MKVFGAFSILGNYSGLFNVPFRSINFNFNKSFQLKKVNLLKQSCKKFKKFRSRSAHHNDLRKKIKIKFTGISELDLSFQFTMI